MIDYSIYAPPVFLVLGILVRIGFDSYILWHHKFNINRLCTLLSYAMLIVVILFSPSVKEEKHIKIFRLICFIGSGLLFLGRIENIKIYIKLLPVSHGEVYAFLWTGLIFAMAENIGFFFIGLWFITSLKGEIKQSKKVKSVNGKDSYVHKVSPETLSRKDFGRGVSGSNSKVEEVYLMNQRSMNEQDRLLQQQMYDEQERLFQQQMHDEQERLFQQQIIDEQNRLFQQWIFDEQNRLFQQQMFDEQNRLFQQQTFDEQNRLFQQQTYDNQNWMQDNYSIPEPPPAFDPFWP